MKEKDKYTFEELCDNLTMPISEFCRRAGITEGTLARLRQGFSARRVTANKLLDAFSKAYKLELSLDNVTGLALEDKKAIRQQMLARKGIPEKVEKPPAMPSAKQAKDAAIKAANRAYTPRKTDLPEGCMLAAEFARMHGVNERRFIDHMIIGLGPGTVPGERTDPVMVVKDHVEYSERVKPGRKRKTADGRVIEEKEKYLTQEQQSAALDFWRRHGVDFKMPETEKETAQ